MNERELFMSAVEIDDLAERSVYLDRACGGDEELRRRLAVLLKAYENACNFLDARIFADSAEDEPQHFLAEGVDPDDTCDAVSSSPAERAPGLSGERTIVEEPGNRIGPYRLLQKLGEGGMGVVFMAEQEQPVRRKVALKIIKPGLDTGQVVARFEAERQALAMMDHQNIARVFDAGATAAGRPYFVMELVEGVELTEYCDAGRLTPRERLELFIPVCRAIQHAHQKGIIHRDIKPSNVLVTIRDGKPVPKVIDFGVAKAIDQSLTEKTLFTQHGALVGTLEYMSPEQAESGALDIDTRSDIYSLGVLLYELLTGSTPLERVRLRRSAYSEILRRIREEDPPRPSTRLSDSGESAPSIAALRKTEPSKLSKMMRGEIDWIVMKSLEKDRRRRYETANAFARDIERYLHDEAVEAGPPSASYKVKKFARKHRKALAGVGLIALVLIASSVISMVSAVRAVRAETRARADRDRALEAEATARKDRLQAEAVSSFMVETLGKADPYQDGAKVLVVDLLDKAKAKLDQGFDGPREIKWALLDAIGRTYLGLGLYQKAVPTLEQVCSAREKALGRDHLDTLSSRNDLAESYNAAGRINDAISLHEATLKLYDAKLGPDNTPAFQIRNNLAIAYTRAGRPADAIALLEPSIKLHEAKYGADHPLTLSSLDNLAGAYREAGRVAEAVLLQESILKKTEQKLGPDHPRTLSSRNNLAHSYLISGRIDEAIQLCEKTLKQREAKLPPNHPDTLISRNNLAGAYMAAGRTDEALPLLETTLKHREADLGSDHPLTLSSRNNLAAAYQRGRRTSDAIALYETTLKRQEAKLGLIHPDTLTSRNNLAAAYLDDGRIDDAIALHQATLKIRESNLGIDHPETLTSRNNLASAYHTAGRPLLAIPLFEAVLKQREAKLGFDHPDTILSRGNLATAYLAADRPADAIPLYEATLRWQDANLGPDDPGSLSTRNNLAGALQKSGRLAESIALFETTLGRREAKFASDDFDTLTTRNNLAGAYQIAGRHADAIPLYETNLERYQAKFGSNHVQTLSISAGLASAYEAEKRWKKAEPLRRKLLDHSRSKSPAESPPLAGALASLGKNLLFQGKPAEAEPFLRESLAIREKKLADDWLRFNAMSLLGGALSGQKKYAEAEPLLIQGYEGMKAREAKIPPQGKINLAEAAARIVSLYEAWGKPEKAAEWREKIKAAPPEAKPETNPKPAEK